MSGPFIIFFSHGNTAHAAQAPVYSVSLSFFSCCLSFCLVGCFLSLKTTLFLVISTLFSSSFLYLLIVL